MHSQIAYSRPTKILPLRKASISNLDCSLTIFRMGSTKSPNKKSQFIGDVAIHFLQSLLRSR